MNYSPKRKSTSSFRKGSGGNESKISQRELRNIEEKSKEEIEKKSKDLRAIEIILDVIENVQAQHQVSFVYVKSEYDGNVIDVSEKTIILDETVKLNWSFYIDIDTSLEKDLDNLVSKPIIFTVYQTRGEIDREIYNQLQSFSQVVQDSKATFDSAVSVYEAFTGEIIDYKDYIKNKEFLQDVKRPKDVKKQDEIPTKDDTNQKLKSKKSDKSSSKQRTSDELVSPSKTSQKIEEPVRVIGMGTMDMLPLVLGNHTFNACVDLKQLTPFEDDQMITYKNVPKMCVTVQIDQSIVFPTHPTIMSLTVESIFNIPQVMSTPELDCRICAWLPLTDKFGWKPVLGNPVFKAEDVEYQMKAWPNIPVVGDNVNATKYRIRRDFDNVRYNSKKNISTVIKKENPKLIYNYIRRLILASHNKTQLHNYLLRYRMILFEIYVGQADTMPALEINDEKQRKSNTSSNSNKVIHEPKKKVHSSKGLHLMALLDVSSLVYPGVTSTRVACQLATYNEKEVYNSTGVQESYFAPKMKPDALNRQTSEKILKKVESEKVIKKKPETSNASNSTKKGAMKSESGVESMKSALPPAPALDEEEEPSIKIFNENGDPTIIIVELEIAEPLVQAKPAEDLMKSLKEMVPVRPTLPKTALGTKIVEENYKNVIHGISMNLNEHLVRYMQEKKECLCSTQADFLTYLRRLGVYQKYILTLRKAISVLINKKYDILDFSLKRNNKKHQDLIGKFFVYLMSQMNSVLNKENCSITGNYKDGLLSSIDSTLLYAKVSCELKKYMSAEKYFMERLCLEEDNPDVWFDYALFQLEMDSPELAFEYLNEALSRKLDHTNSLLLYGILLTEKGKMSDAEICFMTVLVHRPRWVEGWGILFLFYQKNNNAGGMAFAEDMARQYLNDERTEQDYFMRSDDLIWTTDILPRTVFFKTASILLKLRVYYWVEDALAFEIASHTGKVNYLLAVICFFQENYDHALDHLKEARFLEGWNYAIVALTGHCHMWKNEYEAAREQFFYVLESFDRPEDMHMLHIHCAKVLSVLGREQEARKIMLMACKNNPTPHTWMVAGTFFYNENDLLSAEECLTEANICNNRIPEVWAFLTLINLKLDRETEAELCYQQASKNELDDETLIAAINEEIVNFQKRNYDTQVQFSADHIMF